MTTALTRGPFPGMTVDDLLLLEWPHYPEEDRWWMLWEYTGWPAFWSDSTVHPAIQLQRQLRDFREGRYVPDTP